MGTYAIRRSQIVAGDVPSVFGFFKDPSNLAQITPPWLKFRIRWCSDEEIRAGTVMRYRVAWLGFGMTWESVVSQYHENQSFTDEQLRGPYRRWVHTHLFREANGGVEVSDQVQYEMPLGPMGALAHAFAVRRQLKRIFDYRASRLVEIFGRPASRGAGG